MPKKIILVLGTIVVLLLIIFYINNIKPVVENKIEMVKIPTPTSVPATSSFDNPEPNRIPNFLPSLKVQPTGEIIATPTPNEKGEIIVPDIIFPTLDPHDQKIVDAFMKLRGLVPINENGFTIDYDYDIDKFTVKITNSNTAFGVEQFMNWQKGNRYDVIPAEYFKFIN